MTGSNSQVEKFKAAARLLECDESESKFDATLKAISKSNLTSQKADAPEKIEKPEKTKPAK